MLPEADLLLSGDLFERWTVVHALAREVISTVYEATLIVTSPNRDEDPAPLLGSPVDLHVVRGAPGSPTRRLQGVVRALEDLGTTGTHRYARLVVVPWLWTLSQRSDSRIFQDMPVVDIVKAVFRAAGVYDGPRGALVAPGALSNLPSREYCVQYRERDLDFVMRLLQEEGIPFYFQHNAEGGETLVLVDGAAWGTPSLFGGGTTVPVSDTFRATASVETVQSFDPHRAMRPTSTTLREFDFTRPRLHLNDLTTASPSTPGARALYDYPARAPLHAYDDQELEKYTAYDGPRQARIRHEAEIVTALTVQGRGNVTSFAPGLRVLIEGHHAPGPDGGHLITSVEHHYQAWSDLPEDVRASERISRELESAGFRAGARDVVARYENRFETIPSRTVFRPARVTPRPLVYGTQTARVVGPAGEEIHVDPHGRIKVQFHWDREGVEDEESSCWVRCAQGWAGSGWGFVFIPRIGMEVVVTFLEGDPDRPLVTGCVYNGENRPPYGLPGEKTKSTVKTNSSPTTGGYNELRFEDAAGQEQVYLQAERNFDTLVKNDQTVTVLANRTKTIEGNERNTIVLDRMTSVHGNESKEVQGNQDLRVLGESGCVAAIDHNYVLTGGDSIKFQCGDSKLLMLPNRIELYSHTIWIKATETNALRGAVIHLNCADDGMPNTPAKRPSLKSLSQKYGGDEWVPMFQRAAWQDGVDVEKLWGKLVRRILSFGSQTAALSSSDLIHTASQLLQGALTATQPQNLLPVSHGIESCVQAFRANLAGIFDHAPSLQSASNLIQRSVEHPFRASLSFAESFTGSLATLPVELSRPFGRTPLDYARQAIGAIELPRMARASSEMVTTVAYRTIARHIVDLPGASERLRRSP